MGAALPATVAAGATLTIACKDESQPEYWVEKLEDQAWRARAIKRLEQFFEDSLTKANKDLKAQEVQDLIGKTIEPLTKTYVEHGDMLDSKSRVALIKLLAGYKDKRAEPAFKKAFEDFAKAPKSGKDDQDIKWAAIATADAKLESLAGPMLEAFGKLRASTMLGGVVYKDFNAAMLELPSKSWAPALIQKLGAEMTRPQNAKDKSAISDYMDQQFWQTTAAALLGRIGDPAGVEPLIKVLLDPAKVDVHATAMVSLIQLGKPASDAAVKLLKGEHKELQSFCEQRLKDLAQGRETSNKPCTQTAALILGTVGRADSVAPMLEALKTEEDDATKAIIARELPKLPATAESTAAFKAAYESLPLDAQIPPGVPALDSLTEAAGQFFDPSMIDWLLERAEKTKGDASDKKALQQAVLITVTKLAKPDQLATVKRAAQKYGSDLEKGLVASAESLLKACGDRAACYVEALQKPENQDRKNQFVGIKAGYMAAIFGNEQTRDEIVSRLDSIENAAVRFVAAQAIDRLSPKGAKTAVERLNAIIEKNAKSPDRDKALGDAPLKQVMYRLQARSG
ncbi:MAG: hypothetical protein DIU78_022990 [Pseudomonadota bacterium]